MARDKCMTDEETKEFIEMFEKTHPTMPLITLPATYNPIPTTEPRPVLIKFNIEGDRRGLFIGWFNANTELYGIIELSSGEIVKVKSSDFKFLDSKNRFEFFLWEKFNLR